MIGHQDRGSNNGHQDDMPRCYHNRWSLHCNVDLLAHQVDGTVQEEAAIPDDPHATTAGQAVNTHQLWFRVLTGHQQLGIHKVTHLHNKTTIRSQ